MSHTSTDIFLKYSRKLTDVGELSNPAFESQNCLLFLLGQIIDEYVHIIRILLVITAN